LYKNISTCKPQSIIEATKAWKTLPIATLNYKPQEDQWSMLECLQHLNFYGDFYIPEIKQRIEQAKDKNTIYFKTLLSGKS
jgi:hypothetical protein